MLASFHSLPSLLMLISGLPEGEVIDAIASVAIGAYGEGAAGIAEAIIITPELRPVRPHQHVEPAAIGDAVVTLLRFEVQHLDCIQ